MIVPVTNRSFASSASRNAMFVSTPRMRNSRSARSMRSRHSSKLDAQTVTFSSSES